MPTMGAAQGRESRGPGATHHRYSWSVSTEQVTPSHSQTWLVQQDSTSQDSMFGSAGLHSSTWQAGGM